MIQFMRVTYQNFPLLLVRISEMSCDEPMLNNEYGN